MGTTTSARRPFDRTRARNRTGEPLAASARSAGMARPLVPDALLTGMLFVLKSGIPWEMLPREMGCGSGMTCWRRLRDWQRAGVWAKLHRVLLDRLGRANAIDWSRCALDSAAVAAKRGVPKPARTRPTAAVRAASAISWSTQAASRSLSA
jgi:transposase